MENATATATELLDGVVINEVGEHQYMLQRLPDNSQLLGTELLQHHNGLVVDLAAGDFIPVSGYPSEGLLPSDLTDEDKNLAAALVAVQFQSQQQKQQQLQEAAALPTLVSAPLANQQLILSDKEGLSSNGIYHIVGSENMYVEKQTLPKITSGRNYAGSFTRVDVAGRPDDDENKRDNDRQEHHRTSRKSLPHKKRISRKLTKTRQTTTKLFPCNLCEQTFQSHDDFAQHELLCQTTITPVHSSGFSCQLCNCSFQDQLRFFEHLKSHYEPPGNGHQHQQQQQQQQQQQTELDIQQSEHQQQQQQDQQSLNNPLDDNIFGNLMNMTCIQCNKTFRRAKLLEAHIKDVHEKNELENEFSETEDLMEGINVVVDGTDPNSDTDSKAWYREDELHQTEEDLKELEAEDHICHICKQPFPIRAILLQHLVTCRSNTGKSEPTSHTVVKKKNKKKGTLHCPECDKTFTHRNSLVYHMRSHTGIRPHQCDQCGKSFFASSALKVHLRLHSGDKPYHCDECGKKFRQWGDLKYHKTSIHSNEKQFQCEYCGKDFARKYSLIVHRRIHTGEKNYKCEYCSKTFRASSYLQNHRRIHTGEKPHECGICGKPFRVRSDMMRHQKTHSKRAPNGKPVRFVSTTTATATPQPHHPMVEEKFIKTESGSNLSEEVYELNVGEEENSSGQIMEYDQEQIEATVREGGGALYSHGHQLLFVSYAEVPVRNGEASSSWIQTS